eukprot:9997_1
MTGAADKLFSFLKKQMKESGDDDSNSSDDENIEMKNKIPFKNTIENRDPYPSYMYKALWHKSADENLERLIDTCVRVVQKQKCWDDKDWIDALYEDATSLEDDSHHERHTLYDFVKKIYETAGGNEFFDTFVRDNYKREIKIWKRTMKSAKVLNTYEEIFNVLQKITFNEFDINNDSGIDFIEFKTCFRKLGYWLNQAKLKTIFDEIDALHDKDGTITKREYREWQKYQVKQEPKDDFLDLMEEDDEKHQSWYVYYDDNRGIYDFNDAGKSDLELLRGKKNHVAILKQEINDDMKWG